MSLGRFDGPTLTLVVNPAAGRGRARRLLPRVCADLLTGLPGANLRVFQTTDYAEARLRCIQAVEHARPAVEGVRPDALLVMGGDGMAHLGLNACAETDVPLGVIPAGTGNDFCAGAGLATSVPGAVRTIVAGTATKLDLIEVRGKLAGGAQRRFVGCIVSTGWDSRVGLRAGSIKVPLGPLVYAYSGLTELATFEPLTYRLVIDGHPRQVPAMLVAVGNTGVFGGGMHGCPNADPTDGLLDITIIHPVSKLTFLRLLPSLYTGGFARDPAVEMLRGREVLVDGVGLYGSADGEELGPVPLQLTTRPGILNLLAPVHPPVR